MNEITNENNFNIFDGFFAVKFGAKWCQPCKQVDVQLEKLEKEFENVKFLSLDIDNIPKLAQKYQVKSLPTIILFKNGREVKRIVGKPLLDSLRKTIRETYATDRFSYHDELRVANI